MCLPKTGPTACLNRTIYQTFFVFPHRAVSTCYGSLDGGPRGLVVVHDIQNPTGLQFPFNTLDTVYNIFTKYTICYMLYAIYHILQSICYALHTRLYSLLPDTWAPGMGPRKSSAGSRGPRRLRSTWRTLICHRFLGPSGRGGSMGSMNGAGDWRRNHMACS